MTDTASRPAARLAHTDVAELVYAPVSETGGFGHEGSTPSIRINVFNWAPLPETRLDG